MAWTRRVVTVTAAALTGVAAAAGASGPASASAALPPVRHVFVIVLENKGFADTFVAGQPVAPYLTQTLPSMGVLVPGYYGVGHSSADNYLAMVSGQPPTPASKNDCPDPLQSVASDAVGPDNIAKSDGCLYPPDFPTVADQLAAQHLTWKGYMEGIPGPCSLAHDAPGNYARKHNPFVFFLSLRKSGQCAANDVALPALGADLQSVPTTPNLVFVTPNECNDGHTNCMTSSVPSGFPPTDTANELAQADAFLKQWVPRILASPAYQQNGLLIVMFDEADADATACCNEQPGPADPNPGGIGAGSQETPGPGGGQTGAVMLSPFIAPGGVSTTQYNHYSLLRSIEDLFGLSHLGFAAQDGLTPFGADIFTRVPASAPGSGAGAGPATGTGTAGGGGSSGPGTRGDGGAAGTQLIAGGTIRLPRSSACLNRRTLALRLHRRRGLRVRSVDVYVNHRLVTRLAGARLRAPVTLTGLPAGAYRVSVVVHGRRHGRRVTLRDHRTYRTCAGT